MADMMKFPDKFEDFIHDYEFKDEKELYTNGSKLIPSFRVMQAWDHYTNKINTNLNNIYNCLDMIRNNLYDIEDEIE